LIGEASHLRDDSDVRVSATLIPPPMARPMDMSKEDMTARLWIRVEESPSDRLVMEIL
jgi:hypothetical protein